MSLNSRDRSPRGRKGRDEGPSGQSSKRVYISNLPYTMKWQQVKDLFRTEVGEVLYVELFNDEHNKPRGCGILEFPSQEMAKECIEKMHKFDYKGRKINVTEDYGTERDKFGRIINVGRERSRSRHRDRSRDDYDGSYNDYGETFGLSRNFLESLNIKGPLHTRIFVANLSYEVDERKLREVFRLAGRILGIELYRDSSGKSKGFGVIEFSHPVEAVQSISMLHDQVLVDRRLTVRFDNQPPEEDFDELPSRLPDGLKGIGMGLGNNGDPLLDVANNLPDGSGSRSNSGMDVATAMNSVATLARTMGLNLGQMPMNQNMSLGGGSMHGPMSMNGQMDGPQGINRGNINHMGNGHSTGNMGTGASMGPGPQSMSGGPSLGGGYSTGSGPSNSYSGSTGGGPSMMNSSGSESDTIIVRNLPLDCTWQSLRDSFSHCGDIKYAEMKERTTGMIRFASDRDAERAVSMMDQQLLGSRHIDVRHL